MESFLGGGAGLFGEFIGLGGGGKLGGSGRVVVGDWGRREVEGWGAEGDG